MANSNYKAQATAEYDPQYNAKRQAMINSLASNKLTLDNQKTGINSNYDQAVTNQNLNNKKSKNNYSNSAIGRGLTRGTSVTTGLAEQDQINNRVVGNINRERTGELNNIESQKSLLEQNTNNTLAQMAGDRESAISALARQLYGEDFGRQMQQQQLNIQRASQAAENAYRNRALELQASEQAWNRQFQQANSDWNHQMSEKEFNAKYGGGEELSSWGASQAANLNALANDTSLSPQQRAAQINSISNQLKGVNNKDYKQVAKIASTMAKDITKANPSFVPSSYDPYNTGSSGGGFLSNIWNTLFGSTKGNSYSNTINKRFTNP